MIEGSGGDVTTFTADIVSAFVSNNTVDAAALPGIIRDVHGALSGAGAPVEEAEATWTPAVPVKKSVTDDHLISLIDGRKYKSLKRHLKGHDLTPEQYLERYSLPKTYPMVAKSYSEQRSSLAKTLGLGRRAAEPVAPAPVTETIPAPTKARGKRVAQAA